MEEDASSFWHIYMNNLNRPTTYIIIKSCHISQCLMNDIIIIIASGIGVHVYAKHQRQKNRDLSSISSSSSPTTPSVEPKTPSFIWNRSASGGRLLEVEEKFTLIDEDYPTTPISKTTSSRKTFIGLPLTSTTISSTSLASSSPLIRTEK
jgi:hypothetical protein